MLMGTDEHPIHLHTPAVSFILLLHFCPLFCFHPHSTWTCATMTKLHITCYSLQYRTPTKASALSPLTIPSICYHSASLFSAILPRYHLSALYKQLEARRLAGDVSDRLEWFSQCASCQEWCLSGCHSMESLRAVAHILCKSLSPFSITHSTI